MTPSRVVSAALYLLGVWIGLSVLMIQAAWAPEPMLLQSVRLVLMAVAGVTLFTCAIGAGTALLGLAGMGVKPETQSRPYQPPA